MRVEDEPEIRRAASAQRLLDDRLVGLGYRVGPRHGGDCAVGLVPRSPCTCRGQAVAARDAPTPLRAPVSRSLAGI
jgi:hypothetical protein